MDNSAKLIIELKDLASKVAKNIQKAFGDLGKTVDTVTGQTDRFNSVCARLKFPDFRAQLEVLGQFADAVKGITDEGVAFGQSMADLSSITGIAGDDLEALTRSARSFGKESGLGASTAARAYTILASQIQVADIGMEGLNKLEEQSILLAEAAGMSIDDAAASLAGTVNQFGLSADEAGRVVNVLAAGSKYGAAEISDLSESFKVVGSTASAVGLNVEQTTGALEALSKSAIVGSEAGTSLRNVLLALTTKMGVDLNVTSLQDALKALEPELDNTTYLAQMFGRENVGAALSLIQNADAVAKLTEQVTGTNTAQEQAAIRTDTTAHKIEVANARIADMKIALTNLMPSVSVYASILSDNAVNIAAIIQVMSTLKDGIPTLISGISKVTTVVKSLSAATVVQSAVTGQLTIASKAYAAVQTVLNAILTANPIGIVVMAIAALVAAIVVAYNHSEKFRKICDQVWSAVKKVASAIWDFLVKAFEGVTGAVKKAWQWLMNFLGLDRKKVQVDAEVEVTTTYVDESSPDFIGPVRKAATDAAGKDTKVSDDVKKARDAYAGLEKQLKDIAAVNEALGRSQNTVDDQLTTVGRLVEQLIPILGRESTEVRGLVKRYEELTAAKSAALRAKGPIAMGALEKLPSIEGPTATVQNPSGIKAVNSVEKEIEDTQKALQKLNQLQSDLELPGLSEETRNALKSQIAYYRQYLGVTEDVGGSVREAWSSVQNIGNGINSMTEALEGNGSAWEKLTATVNGFIGVMDAVKSVIAIIDRMTGATKASAAATQAKGAAEVAAAGQAAGAAQTEIAANVAVGTSEQAKGNSSIFSAAAGLFSAHSAIPIVGVGIAAGLVATMLAIIASLPKFAEGGIAYGPTLGLFGEYSGAKSNPEVVAPLNRLRSLIGAGDGLGGKVEFEIRGDRLYGVLQRRANLMGRR